MKYLKMLGLAAIAAAALTALVGAGAASATVLCKNNLNTEKCSEPYAVGTKGTASLVAETNAVIEEVGPEGEALDVCQGSTATETLQNAGSATTTVTGKVEASGITWSKCTFTTKTISGGETELHWIAGTDNGTLTAKGFEVTINTIFFGSCTYGLGSTMKDWGNIVGGAPGSFTVNAIVSKISGGVSCPTEARVTGKYTNTEPKTGYVAGS
jgi:hypothetical protein